MNYAISIELQFFLISVLWGAILLLVYDFLRISRRLIKHDSFFIALEDLIYWVCASLFIFVMMYKKNDGIIRGFSIMGMAIGMVLYHFMLSSLIVNIITKLIRTIISPIVFVLNKIKKMLKFIWSKGKIASNFLFERLKKRIKSVKIALEKRKLAAALKNQLRSKEKQQKKQRMNENKQRKNEKKKAVEKSKDSKRAVKKSSREVKHTSKKQG